jgi:SAM-dependent methyltransferase
MKKSEYDRMFQFEDWYWWYQGLHALVQTVLREAAGGGPLSVLDAGCGTGRMLEMLGDCGRTEGFDSSADAIEWCRHRGLVHCQQMDLNRWEPEACRWDVIISLDVLCCEGVQDDHAVLEKFHGALTPGGILVLNLPAFPLLRRAHDVAVSSVRRYRRKEVTRELESLGFGIRSSGYRLPPLFAFLLIKKMIENIFHSGRLESDLRPLPSALNRLLFGYHRLENSLIRRGVRFPFGSSLFLLAVKNPQTGGSH